MQAQGRLDAELLKDGTVFKYIGQYIQANPTPGRSASNPSPLPTTRDLQRFWHEEKSPHLQHQNKNDSFRYIFVSCKGTSSTAMIFSLLIQKLQTDYQKEIITKIS